jgi:hypothetical protein
MNDIAMSNPVNTTEMKTPADHSGLITFLGAIIVAFVVYKSPMTDWKYRIGIILFGCILAFIINIWFQYNACTKTDIIYALQGIWPTFITMITGFTISWFRWCRMPVMSVFAPMILNGKVDVTTNVSTTNANSLKRRNGTNNAEKSACCTPKLTIEAIEKDPSMLSLSYAFYSFFAMLFGLTFGRAYAIIC